MEIKVNVGDVNTYLVVVFGEVDIMTNALRAIARFRSVTGALWPSEVVVHENNRMCLSLPTTQRKAPWNLRDALYMLTAYPIKGDEESERVPVVFDGERKPVGKAFRDRPLRKGI